MTIIFKNCFIKIKKNKCKFNLVGTYDTRIIHTNFEILITILVKLQKVW